MPSELHAQVCAGEVSSAWEVEQPHWQEQAEGFTDSFFLSKTKQCHHKNLLLYQRILNDIEEIPD